MQIPGQTRLGQGFPGGAGALSPGVTGLTPGVPTFGSTPRIQAPPPGLGLGSGMGLPTYAQSTGRSYEFTDPNVSSLQRLGTTPSTKAYKLAEALQIVERIRRGWLSEKNAARMLKRFPIEIRRQLAEELGTKSKSAVNLAHKLQIDQNQLAPTPSGKGDKGFLGTLVDNPATTLLRNYSKDVEAAATGFIPESYRAAKALGADIADLPGLLSPGAIGRGRQGQQIEPLKETRRQVFDPIVEQYKYQYGPALRGDFGTSAERIYEHPLGPTLDLLALASAGIGTGARVSSALGAVRRLPGAEKPMMRMTPEGLAQKPNELRFPVAQMLNGEIRVGRPGQGHDELWTPEEREMLTRVRQEDPDLADKYEFDSMVQGTGIFDPETGKVANINVGKEYTADLERELGDYGITHDRVHDPQLEGLRGQMEEVAKEFYEGRPGPTGREKFTAARKGFARPKHRGSLIDFYERRGGLALGARYQAAKEAAGFTRGEAPEGPEMPGEGPPAVPPEAGPTPEAPAPGRPDPKAPDPVTGVPMEFFKRPTPEQVVAEPYLNHFSGFYNADTGETIVGHVGSAHADVMEGGELYARRPDLAEGVDAGPPWFSYTGIFDPDDSSVAKINFNEREGEALAPPEAEATVKAAADSKFWSGDDPTSATPGVETTPESQTALTPEVVPGEPTKPATLSEAEKVDELKLFEEKAGRELTSEELGEIQSGRISQVLREKIGVPALAEGQVRLGTLSPGDYFKFAETEFVVDSISGKKIFATATGGKLKGVYGDEPTEFSNVSPVTRAGEAPKKGPGRDIPDEEYRRPTVEELNGSERWKNYFSVFVNKDTKETLISPPGWDHYQMYDEMGGLEKKMGGRPEDPREFKPDSPWLTGTGIFDPDTADIARVNLWRRQKEGDDRDFALETTSSELKALSEHVKVEAEEKFWRNEPTPEAPSGPPPPTEPPTAAAPGEPAPETPPPLPTQRELDLKAGVGAFFRDQEAITHATELKNIEDAIMSTAMAEDLRYTRRSFKEVLAEVKSDLKATRLQGKQRPAEMSAKLPGFISPATGKALSMVETTVREASDLVRAGAIYLRPAYLPNNWASNGFMNVVSQGALAPVNLAKALVIDKHIGQHYTRIMDSAMGTTAAQVVTAAKGRGYVGSLSNPLAEIMGKIADSPFRRSQLLHELRKVDIDTLSKVKAHLDKVVDGDEQALRTLSEASRKAQEEIIKFGKYNEMESSVLRNIVFVYSWMRGAGRYATRFPFQHPIQAAAATHLGQEGKEWLESEMGGVPSFLMGAVPVGRDDEGNPILINPFTLNPLGTGVDIMRALGGTAKVIRNPNEFNKYAEEDIMSLLNPLIQAYSEAREGGNPPLDEAMRAIAPIRLGHELRHPGAGGVYPTSRKEAIGKWTFGTLFPRQADQAAITRAFERENVGNRANLIPQQIKQYKKFTGEDMPEEMITAYRRDLQMADDIKSFQKEYANDHGQQGFRNMPPINRAKAALDFHRQYGVIPDQQLNLIEEQIKVIKQDVVLNNIANGLWAATGAGSIKRSWDQMLKDAKGLQFTRERP